MQVEKHIHDLLYTADCVIVPGLGGFVANTRGAFMNPAQHTFSPPFKRIAFNAGLHVNDGLLAHYISSKEGVTYGEALEGIALFVEDVFGRIQAGTPAVLDKIGSLSFDLEQHLQFEPDMQVNYLSSSFGLSTIHSPAIRRDEQPTRLRPVKQQPVKTAKVKKMSPWRFIELVPVAAILTLLMLNPSVVKNLNQGLATLNPFQQAPVEIQVQPSPQYMNDTAIATPVQESDSTTAASEFALPDSAAAYAVTPPETTPVESTPAATQPEATPAQLTAEPVHTHVEKPAAVSAELAGTSGNYYIIGGCFSVTENAQKFRDQAIALGFKAEIIGLNDKGLQMVSIVSGANATEVRSRLSEVKEKLEKGAWVYTRR